MTEPREEILRVGPLTFDLADREAGWRGTYAILRPREGRVLEALARQPDRVFSPEDLCEQLGITLDNLRSAVSMLRRTLGDDVVWTEEGVGYQLGTDRRLRAGSLTLDLDTGVARRDSRSAKPRPKDSELLETLMREPSRVFSRQELIDKHWGGVGDIRVVANAVGRLRAKLGDDVIRTVYGVGYQLGRPAISLRAGKLRLDEQARQIWNGDRGPADLTNRERNLAALVMGRVGRLATRAELIAVGCRAGTNPDGYSQMFKTLEQKLPRIGAGGLFLRVRGGCRVAGSEGFLRVAGLELDLEEETACVDGRPLELTPLWFALLERLARTPGKSVPDADLIEHAWGTRARFQPLDKVMQSLRRAMGPTGEQLIERGEGGWRLAIKRFGLLAVGPLLLDPAALCVRLRDREEELSEAESRVAELLMRDPDRVVSRAEVSAAAGVKEEGLSHFIWKLRRKLRRLDDSAGKAGLIVTVPGLGWRIDREHLEGGAGH